jgi:hypothetical protein
MRRIILLRTASGAVRSPRRPVSTLSNLGCVFISRREPVYSLAGSKLRRGSRVARIITSYPVFDLYEHHVQLRKETHVALSYMFPQVQSKKVQSQRVGLLFQDDEVGM